MFKNNTCKECGLPSAVVPHYGYLDNSQSKCNYCKSYSNLRDEYDVDYKNNQVELDIIIEQCRGREEYDCIVLFTGGKDSTYTLNLMVNKYKLKVLALTWDNGFFNDEVLRNIENVVKNLQVDHKFVGPSWDIMKELYRNRLNNYGRFCQCVPLSILFAAPEIYQNKAPLVFCSISFGQLISMVEKAVPHDVPPKVSSKLFKRILSAMGKVPIKRIVDNIYYTNMVDIAVGNLSVPVLETMGNLYDCLNKLREIKDIHFIHPSYYYDWKAEDIISSIQEIGWTMPEGKSDYGHTSCYVEPIKGYLSYKQDIINFDLLEVAALSRTKKINKDEFKDEIRTLGYGNEEPAELDVFLERLDMTKEELNDIINRQLGKRSSLPEINEESLKYLPVKKEIAKENMEKAFREKVLI